MLQSTDGPLPIKKGPEAILFVHWITEARSVHPSTHTSVPSSIVTSRYSLEGMFHLVLKFAQYITLSTGLYEMDCLPQYLGSNGNIRLL